MKCITKDPYATKLYFFICYKSTVRCKLERFLCLAEKCKEFYQKFFYNVHYFLKMQKRVNIIYDTGCLEGKTVTTC